MATRSDMPTGGNARDQCLANRDLLLWQGLSQIALNHFRSQDSMSNTSPSKSSPIAEWFIKAFTPGWGYVIEVNGVKAFRSAHPSPLSIDSLNLFKNAVLWLNAKSELVHKHQ
ncbi:hypothetical protein [Prochlorococcus sp. MIT 1306]|uniref:hypothetical protein n=2 Tax=Prochlorococcus sp. MIT 1306 TaxID=1799667 RepID=UPI0012E84B79|nr:hypothetical protein [Prochlorococcus sp. MIT 1306]